MINYESSVEFEDTGKNNAPIVALESTVQIRKRPRPQNLQLERDIKRTVREESAMPATNGFLDGYLHIGMNDAELERLAKVKDPYKVGPRDFATVITNEANGGTTMARIMLACKHANPIPIFQRTYNHLQLYR